MIDSAVWLTCRDCGHSARVLARMANRVLKARTRCAECLSTCEPCLNPTPAGRNISLSTEQSYALREMDDKEVRGWLEEEARRSSQEIPALQWALAAGSHLAGRFSRAIASHRATAQAGRLMHGEQGQRIQRQRNDSYHDTVTIVETGSAAIRL